MGGLTPRSAAWKPLWSFSHADHCQGGANRSSSDVTYIFIFCYPSVCCVFVAEQLISYRTVSSNPLLPFSPLPPFAPLAQLHPHPHHPQLHSLQGKRGTFSTQISPYLCNLQKVRSKQICFRAFSGLLVECVYTWWSINSHFKRPHLALVNWGFSLHTFFSLCNGALSMHGA